ncbi:unnamed protein product, partial [Mesorhabditis spiculigera]
MPASWRKIAELKTCVPSLHIAAGFSQLNATDNIFPLELVTFSKDVPFSPMNPRRPTPKGEIPRAVCGSCPKLQGGDSDPETFTRLPDEEGPSAWWAVLVIGVLLLLIAIFAVIFWLLWRKRGSGKST